MTDLESLLPCPFCGSVNVGLRHLGAPDEDGHQDTHVCSDVRAEVLLRELCDDCQPNLDQARILMERHGLSLADARERLGQGVGA